MTPTVIHGEAACVLRGMAAQSIDMVYLDPPFGNGLIWKAKGGEFSDKHVWNEAAQQRHARVTAAIPFSEMMLSAMPTKDSDRAYLVMIAEILFELRRVMKPSASIWLHCDDTMGSYLYLVLGLVFGPDMALGEVIWKRTSAHRTTRAFGRVHDTIFAFARSRVTKWKLARCRAHEANEIVYGDPCEQVCVAGFAEDRLNSQAKENVDYPTQKPLALLSRLISAATLPGDLVIDPTCGSGTTLVAAESLGRKAIGIDLSEKAVASARARLSGSALAVKTHKHRASSNATHHLPLFDGALT